MTSDLLFFGVTLLLLIMASGFFSGAETGLTAVSRAQLHSLANSGNRSAAVARDLLKRKDRLISTILLGNNLVNILGTALATKTALELFGNDGVAIATVFMTVIILIFAEIMPKTFAINHAEQVALLVARPMRFFMIIFTPFTAAIERIAPLLYKLAGVKYDPDNASNRPDLKNIIMLFHDEGDVVKGEKDMLAGVLDLNRRDIGSVMIHRRNIYSVNIELPFEEIRDAVLKSPHSRVPLWKDTPENIVAVLHVKSLVTAMRDAENARAAGKEYSYDINALTVEPWFVPETISLNLQLSDFLRRNRHLALAVDEYGDITGLITLEDILEEIVGQIRDETDKGAGDGIRPAKDGTSVTVAGSDTVYDINKRMDWDIPEGYANTAAGVVMHYTGAIPEKGAFCEEEGYKYEVLDMEENRIKRVRISVTAVDEQE